MDVTCAIIRNEEGKILIVQRGGNGDHPFKWEFPGGKVKKEETPEDCIIREIDEELEMDIIISGSLESVEYDYGNKQVRLLPFICDTLNLVPVLNEHKDYKWIQADELGNIDFCEADVIVAGKYASSVNKLTDREQVPKNSKSAEETDSDLQEVINRIMRVAEVDFMALSAVENPEILSKLFEYSGSSNRRLAFRASWALSKLCDRAPDILIPWNKVIVKTILQTTNESVERSFLRILSLLDIRNLDQNHQGLVADHCFKALNSGTSAIAVKAYSMELIYKLAVLYPDLANELAVSINMLKGEGSAGIKARGRIILKKLAEISRGQQSNL